MKNNLQLDELTIKNALKEGLITEKEAREMLTVYLQKSNFNPIYSQFISTQPFSNSNHI